MSKKAEEVQEDGKPPFFKRWSGMYWLLMITLAVLIVLFYLFMVNFS
ncbi:MAG: hypothetical protein ACJAS3_001181 [Roseivirga sp.]|jgi:hypothetical protein